jgi:hypothetical protein
MHDPANAAERRRAQRLGGARSANRSRKGINPENLGPLRTPEDAERWCVEAARAVAAGQITPAAGNAVRGLVSQFLQAQDAGKVRARLEELTTRFERLQRQGRL